MTAKPVPEHISDERLAEIIKGCEGVTPGPWDVWMESTPSKDRAIDELAHQVNSTPDADFAEAVYLLNANGKCPATTGCGPSSAVNAAYLARLDPQTVLSLLTELQHRREAEAGTPEGWALVPREPTEAMYAAGQELVSHARRVWADMLAAAPKPNHHGGRLICEALGFDPTNHHNAAKCPYCTPDAVSPSSPASGVRVKLEWQGDEAKTPFGRYTVTRTDDGYLAAFECDEVAHVGFNALDEPRRAAQDHAQADYEARILSAIGEHP